MHSDASHVLLPIRVHFHGPHPTQPPDWIDRLLTLLADEYHHATLQISETIYDFALEGRCACHVEAMRKIYPPSLTIDLGIIPVQRAALHEVVHADFRRLTRNCTWFIARILDLPHPRSIMTPVRLLRAIRRSYPDRVSPEG